MYLISYDLHDANGEEYTELGETIKRLSTGWWAHPLESTWLISSTQTAASLSTSLKSVIHGMRPAVVRGSRWVVTPIRLGDATGWLNDSDVAWWSKAMAAGY